MKKPGLRHGLLLCGDEEIDACRIVKSILDRLPRTNNEKPRVDAPCQRFPGMRFRFGNRSRLRCHAMNPARFKNGEFPSRKGVCCRMVRGNGDGQQRRSLQGSRLPAIMKKIAKEAMGVVQNAALYEISGTVVPGKRMGRKLGFPTANVQPDGSVPQARGVYAGRMDWGEGPRPCMVNIGAHPTLPEGPPTIEAHVPGSVPDLYGRHVRLRLEHYLRAERKFDSVDALREQLQKDVAQTMKLYGSEGRC